MIWFKYVWVCLADRWLGGEIRLGFLYQGAFYLG